MTLSPVAFAQQALRREPESPPDDGWLEAPPSEPDTPSNSDEPRGDRGRFDVASTSEIFAPLPPVKRLVGALDMCPGAPVLVAGYGFSGKTLAAQSMALSLAAGLPIWGAYKCDAGPALHVDYEQGRRLTYERYQRLAWDLQVGPADVAGGLRVASHPGLYLDSDAGLDALKSALDGCRLGIVDSLRACAPSVDENSSEVRRVLDGLGRVSEATGATVIVIHHARKPSQERSGGAKMAIRGSGAIFDACSSVLVFEGAKGRPVRVSHEKARNTGILAGDFELVIEDVADDRGNARAGLRVTAQALSVERTEETDSLDKAVLGWLQEHPGASGRQVVVSHPAVPKNAIYDALARLQVAGLAYEAEGPRRSKVWRAREAKR